MSLHDGFRMYVAPDAYTLEPLSAAGSEKGQVLVIDRTKNEIRLDASSSLAGTEKVMTVHGVMGIIPLHTTDFLVVITDARRVARILGQDVFLATDFRVLPIDRNATPSLLQHPVEKTLLRLVKNHLYSGPFYFSYKWDLTNTMQRQRKLEEQGRGQEPLWKRADDRFFWNRHLQTRFIDITQSPNGPDLSFFILPVVFGFLEIKSAVINSNPFLFGLIARRSRHRAGTRYFSRGVDAQGNTSNFNETEQFIVLDPVPEAGVGPGAVEAAEKGGVGVGRGDGSVRMSYVQTRGSVPVYWAEVNNLRYKPDLQIMEKSTTIESVRRHFDQQIGLYGPVYIVNLVNQKGYERPVKEAFERAVQALGNPDMHYTYFDFHHECKNMRWERVSLLAERLEAQGWRRDEFFHLDVSTQSNPVRHMQSQVVRTNCMDCLDRTNVVQSTIGRWILTQQLRQVGVLHEKESVEEHSEFMTLFRNVWADHADVISKAYSGTGALKTDFTRTGKRTREGALNDGINSAMRYIKNNFLDGPRQDAYDLFTGAWDSRKEGGASFGDQRELLVRAVPYILMFSLLMVLAGMLLPNSGGHSMRSFILFWLAVSTGCLFYILQRGVDYVAWPSLNRPIETIEYEGPGYMSGKHGRLGYKKTGVASPAYASKLNNSRGSSSWQAGHDRRQSRIAIEMSAGKQRID